ncbi:MAG TPA: histidine kinase [Casimicrobiaceae bacterium]|nr:histidine kinase [Casimicrobiaceae bacterium]
MIATRFAAGTVRGDRGAGDERTMRAIINQKAKPPSLPELRNLGTLLRILLAVNGAALVIVFAREARWEALSVAWIETAAFVEPHLLLCVFLLYVLAPWLERLPYRTGAIAIMAIILAAVLLLDALLARLVSNIGPVDVLRHALFALFMAAMLLGYFHLRARALSPAIAEARLQALQARIRPHFLFNSLNAVLSLVRTEPRRAETALEDLADLFRVLMKDNRQLAPLADEIELCRQYLDLEKVRLGDRLQVEWHVENMPRDALVPPLVLQPLLENAVYHGIEPSSGTGVIAVNIFLRRGEVHAILRNPYKLTGSHHGGNKMAVDNIRERLALHFDAEATLESRVNRDSYEVHIRMPYRVAQEEDARV